MYKVGDKVVYFQNTHKWSLMEVRGVIGKTFTVMELEGSNHVAIKIEGLNRYWNAPVDDIRHLTPLEEVLE